MARRNGHPFRKGFLLGGLLAAGATIWNAPQAGARTREQIQETLEGGLFKVLDFPAAMQGGSVTSAAASAWTPPPAPAPAAETAASATAD